MSMVSRREKVSENTVTTTDRRMRDNAVSSRWRTDVLSATNSCVALMTGRPLQALIKFREVSIESDENDVQRDVKVIVKKAKTLPQRLFGPLAQATSPG